MNAGLRGKRALVVEDDRLDQITIRSRLETDGYQVVVVADGRQALAPLALGENEPSILTGNV